MKFEVEFYLPAHRVLPVEIQTVEVVLLDELNDIGDELPSRAGAVNQSAVLVASGIVPAAYRHEDLLSLRPVRDHALVEF